jgi:hypothetical protein
LLFVVEEVHTFVGRDGRYDDAFEDLILCGSGHYDVGLVLVTQMPQDIGRALLAMPNRWNIFGTFDPYHLRVFEQRCRGLALSDVVNLGQFEYVEWVQDAANYWICRDDPERGTTDRREREFTYARDGTSGASADHRDVGTGGDAARESKDGAALVPLPSDQRTAVDGPHERDNSSPPGPHLL